MKKTILSFAAVLAILGTAWAFDNPEDSVWCDNEQTPQIACEQQFPNRSLSSSTGDFIDDLPCDSSPAGNCTDNAPVYSSD